MYSMQRKAYSCIRQKKAGRIANLRRRFATFCNVKRQVLFAPAQILQLHTDPLQPLTEAAEDLVGDCVRLCGDIAGGNGSRTRASDNNVRVSCVDIRNFADVHHGLIHAHTADDGSFAAFEQDVPDAAGQCAGEIVCTADYFLFNSVLAK